MLEKPAESAAELGEFDTRAKSNFRIDCGDALVGVLQFRMCSICERGKIALTDSPRGEAVANPFEKHQGAFRLCAVFRAASSLALQRDKGAERRGGCDIACSGGRRSRRRITDPERL